MVEQALVSHTPYHPNISARTQGPSVPLAALTASLIYFETTSPLSEHTPYETMLSKIGATFESSFSW